MADTSQRRGESALVLSRARIAAAWRTIRAAHRLRATGTRRDVAIRGGADMAPVGRLDLVEVRGGQVRVVGWARSKKLTLSTDEASLDVVPDPSTHAFDVNLRGTARLTASTETGARTELDALVVPAHPGNLARTVGALLGLLVRNGADIWRYLAQGDTAAGTRLETILVPPPDTPSLPVAVAGLFGGAPLPDLGQRIDIIVPVHDAADDLARCLSALEAHTDRRHRPILIDDASADPRVLPMLRAFCKRWPTARLIEHGENKGFVAAVNAGLEAAQDHVVILNTDAFVPAGWLDRLMAPILADPSVASVTPMSSNAEILTAPVDCRPAALPDGAADRIDAAARMLDWRVAQADLPTGVGYCMALSGHWLAKVSGFDPSFGEGYGEEVDWCRKTAALGARHVGLGALYVEHRGAGSFGPDRLRRVLRGNRLVARRYPGYDASVADFRRTDPLVGPRLALGIAAIDGDEPLPVYLAHRLGGGAELWLSDTLEEATSSGNSVLVVRDGDEDGQVLIELCTPEGRTRGLVPLNELMHYLAGARRLRIVYSCLVGSRRPLALIGTLLRALRLEDAVTLLFHDYFPLCPSNTLIGSDGRYCGLPDAASCQACYARLPNLTGERPDGISDWRSAWRAVADRADRILVFSEDSRRRLRTVWPDLDGKVRVSEHAVGHLPRPVSRSSADLRVVGILGAIGYAKGAAVVRELAELADPDLRLVLIGRIDPDYAHPRLVVHGPYGRDEIAGLAERYRVSRWLIPSIWPETFSYAVRECLATGLPVFGFDLGAQAEVLKGAPTGHVLPPDLPAPALRDALLAGSR